MEENESTVVKEIREIGLKFYRTAFKDIKKRFFINDDLFKRLVFIKPRVTVDAQKRTEIPDDYLCDKFFKSVDPTKVSLEWRLLTHRIEKIAKEKIEEYKEMEVEDFWHVIF